MAVFQVTTTYKDRKASAETLLLSTNKVGDIQAYSTVSEFYYAASDNETILYRTALTKDQLTTLVDNATEFNDRVELPILGKSVVRTKTLGSNDLFDSTTTINVDMDNLIQGKDIGSTSTSYLLFGFGGKKILYKVDDTIANIESASSTSTSIA